MAKGNLSKTYHGKGRADEETLESIRLHLSDKNNPHKVTAEQVGAFTKEKANLLAYAQPSAGLEIEGGVVKSIGTCTDEHIVIPEFDAEGNAVVMIGDTVFGSLLGDSGGFIKSIVIPPSIRRLLTNVIDGRYCPNLEAVYIMNPYLKWLGSQTFRLGASVKDVYFAGTRERWVELNMVDNKYAGALISLADENIASGIIPTMHYGYFATMKDVEKAFENFIIEDGVSDNSVQQKGNNVAGGKGYRITDVYPAGLGSDGLYHITYYCNTDVTGFEKGDVVSIRLDANYDMCGEIESAVLNEVVVKLYNNDTALLLDKLSANNSGDNNTICVPLKPDVGNVDIGINAAAFGGGNIASGAYSFASGNGCKALGRYAFAEGYGTQAGYMSHAEGNLTKALNESHAEGYKTVSEGENSHAEGSSSVAVGQNSHAEGTQTQAVGASSHAEGYNAKAEGAYSHAEGAGQNGSFVIASGTASHAEGRNTKSSGNYSHAEGSSTIASGESSHAEGTSVQAVGQCSHAEGVNTHASGRCSHVEGGGADGVWSYATAPFSHAEGKCVNASSEAQHVQGRYNVADSKGVYAHIVGGGTSGSDRKNIHTLDWSGNAFYSGSVEVSAVILRSSTTGSSKRFKLTVDDSGTLSVTAV